MGQRIIGLTGGIAAGKTTVSDCLAKQYRLPVLDADIYARQAVEPGSPILGAIAARYGPAILQTDGSLNRKALGNVVFQNAAEKQWLEGQIHPFVRDRFAEATAQLPLNQTLVHAIPLLFEAHLESQVSEIWVVTCHLHQQLQRLMQRDRLSQAQAQARIESQMPVAEKVARADVVLDNSQTLAHLQTQIEQALIRAYH
ncbi:MAG: dephospho-CoA kinase [Cyanobacteria bacterium P01_D01_bin.128]